MQIPHHQDQAAPDPAFLSEVVCPEWPMYCLTAEAQKQRAQGLLDLQACPSEPVAGMKHFFVVEVGADAVWMVCLAFAVACWQPEA